MAKRFSSFQEVRQYAEALPISKLVEYAAKYLDAQNEEEFKITVSQEEFDRITNLFRIRGFNADGSICTKGRPRKIVEPVEVKDETLIFPEK